MFDKDFVLLDTECTATENSWKNDWAGEHREIIQIGAIGVDVSGLHAAWTYRAYVRPVLQPVLSAYIKELTGITQEDVDKKGISLAATLGHIAQAAGEKLILCYGRDGEFIRSNCALLKIRCPIESERFVNLKPALAPILRAEGVDPGAYTSGTLREAFGLPGSRAHDALGDMQNLLSVLQELRKRGRI